MIPNVDGDKIVLSQCKNFKSKSDLKRAKKHFKLQVSCRHNHNARKNTMAIIGCARRTIEPTHYNSAPFLKWI